MMLIVKQFSCNIRLNSVVLNRNGTAKMRAETFRGQEVEISIDRFVESI